MCLRKQIKDTCSLHSIGTITSASKAEPIQHEAVSEASRRYRLSHQTPLSPQKVVQTVTEHNTQSSDVTSTPESCSDSDWTQHSVIRLHFHPRKLFRQWLDTTLSHQTPLPPQKVVQTVTGHNTQSSDSTSTPESCSDSDWTQHSVIRLHFHPRKLFRQLLNTTLSHQTPLPPQKVVQTVTEHNTQSSDSTSTPESCSDSYWTQHSVIRLHFHPRKLFRQWLNTTLSHQTPLPPQKVVQTVTEHNTQLIDLICQQLI